MNCQTAINYLEDYLDGFLDETSRERIQGHLERCSDCRDRLVREQELRSALKALPVPALDPDFAARAFKHAATRRARRRIDFSAMIKVAASILIIIALGVVFKGAWGPGQPQWPEVSVAMNEPEEIQLVFYSAESVRDVIFTLELPAGIELVGFENKRELVWKGALEQGSNLLVLPVIVRNRNGGSLIAKIRHGKRKKQFGLLLKVQEPASPGTGAKRFEGKLLTNNLI